MAELNMADGDVLTSTDTDLIDQQMVVSCTSSTRPTGIDGRMIFETDTEKVMIYDASAAAWSVVASSRWVSFTPSWASGVTVGDGTQTARYRWTPAGLHVLVRFVLGSTSAITGSVTITHPASHSYSTVAGLAYGVARLADIGTIGHAGSVEYASATTSIVRAHQVSGADVQLAALSASVPHTWASTDELILNYVVPSA